MEENFSTYFNQTAKVARQYLEARLDIIKLQTAGKLSKALGLFFSLLITILLFFFVVVFCGMVVGYCIGEMTNSFTIGFSCAAGLFILLLLIILLFRKPLIQRPLSKLLLSVMVNEILDHDEKPVNNRNQSLPAHHDAGYVPDEEATENTMKT